MSTSIGTRIGQFVWHQLMTTDVERAKSFYTGLMGWEIEVWKPGELDVPMIKVGDRTHGGFQDSKGAPSHWVGHVAVESADAALARAEANGGGAVAPPVDLPEVGRFVAIRDPEGAVLSAYAPAGEGELAGGVFVWDELMTGDIEAAKRFYGDVFGWEASDMDMPSGTYTLFKRTGGADTAGMLRKPEGMPTAAWLPYLGADDVDATVARAKQLGATALLEGMDVPGVGRVAVLHDPTGGLFGLFHPRRRLRSRTTVAAGRFSPEGAIARRGTLDEFQ